VTREFLVGTQQYTRTQFPLVLFYVITVHKTGGLLWAERSSTCHVSGRDCEMVMFDLRIIYNLTNYMLSL
jgi:hypothetical protein